MTRPTDLPSELQIAAGPVNLTVPTRLLMEIDLRADRYVQIDFRNVAQDSIPLHLSLRRDERLIAANRWSAKGWRREVVFDADLGKSVHQLQLELSHALHGGICVTLWLDGVCLGRLDGLPRRCSGARFGVRRGFPDLGDLGWMTWPAGLISLRRLTPGTFGDLTVTPHLELALSCPAKDAWLDLGAGEKGAVFVTPFEGGRAAPQLAAIPGRIWRDQSGTEAVLIARSPAGSEIARMVLRHSDMKTMLGRADLPWLLQHDALARLQWLEHVHFAGLWQEVPMAVREILVREAARNPASGFLPKTAVVVTPAQAPPDPVRTACDAFHRSRNAAHPSDPVFCFKAQARIAGLNAAQVRQLAFHLSEWFCLSSDPRALARAAREFGVTDWTSDTDAWGRVAGLPFLWADAEWTLCITQLRDMLSKKPDWVVTPALAWFARAIARDLASCDDTRPDMATRVVLAQKLLQVVVEFSRSHGAQTGCTQLIAAVTDLLEDSAGFPDWCQRQFSQLALQAYGLNVDFWQQPLARLPAVLHSWRSAFMALHAACRSADRAQIHLRARPFLTHPIAGRDTLARLALGPHALPVGTDGLPDLTVLTGVAAPAQIEEAALRWLAFPRSSDARARLPLTLDTPVHRAACAGLRGASPGIERPPHARVQQQLGEMIQGALSDLRADRPIAPEAFAQILDAARKLMMHEAGFLGLAALLALAESLARAGTTAQARACVTECLAHMRGISVDQLQAAPAVAIALARFEALCPDPTLRAQLRKVAPADPALLPPVSQVRQLEALRKRSNPFSDTLVALISCHANLNTRVRDVHAAWGKALADHGIPLVTVVGRPSGQQPGLGHRFDGRFLHLDVSDDYEGLPQKTLALADWVLNSTGFGRVLKIDDDCFLDAEAFFSDPAFMTVPYFGRGLHRGAGDMDRAWHMARARGPRGRFELDKSPEPSRYADGGTGYVLNRAALRALQVSRATGRGQALEQLSFMEDKLVGDLLAPCGIEVEGPGFDLSIFRKVALTVPAIPQYHDGFLPFAGAAIKLAHLDSGASVQDVAKGRTEPWPMPMKVWPLHRPAGLGWAQHGLTLISPPARLERAQSAACAVISVMRDEGFMIEHFLTHYRRLGVEGFLVVDNGSRDGTLEYLASQEDVAVFSTDTPYNKSAYGVIWQEALLAQFRLGKWSLIADADELLFWSLPDAAGQVRGNLPDLLQRPEFAKADAARVFMFDLYPKGPLRDVQFATAPFLEAGYLDREPLLADWQGRGPWSNADTHTSALRHRLMCEAGLSVRADLFVAQKYPLLRYHPFMHLSTGLHYCAGATCAGRDLAFGHFKYHAQFHAKAAQEAARGQHFNNAEEYRNYLRLQAEGRDSLYQPGVSVPLADCRKLREICDVPQADPFAGIRAQLPVMRAERRRAMRYTLSLPKSALRAHALSAG